MRGVRGDQLPECPVAAECVVEGNGSLSAISFFRAYPTRELEVSIPALLNLMGKASSISELVRFFSESPLDGRRGDNASQPAGTP